MSSKCSRVPYIRRYIDSNVEVGSRAPWDMSDNNRRAKYYQLTATGRKQLEAETEDWRRLVAAVAQVLETA